MFIARAGAAALILTVLGQPTPAPPLGQPTPAPPLGQPTPAPPLGQPTPAPPLGQQPPRSAGPGPRAAATQAADPRRHPARRVRALPREQRPPLVSPRRAGRSGEEVDRRQEHHPLQDAQGRHAHPARSLRQPERRQDPARDDPAQVRARDQHRLGRLPAAAEGRPRVRDRLLLLGQPEGDGPVRRHGVQEGSGRQGLDLHRLRGRRRGDLVAEQGPVARRSREDGDQRRDPQRPDRRLERQVRRARPIWATATPAGTGRCSTRSTTTACR